VTTEKAEAWQQRLKLGAFGLPVALAFMIWTELGEIKTEMRDMSIQLTVFVTKVSNQQDTLRSHDLRITGCINRMTSSERVLESLKERIKQHERQDFKRRE